MNHGRIKQLHCPWLFAWAFLNLSFLSFMETDDLRRPEEKKTSCSIFMDTLQLCQACRFSTMRQFLPPSPQEFLILIWSTFEGWPSQLFEIWDLWDLRCLTTLIFQSQLYPCKNNVHAIVCSLRLRCIRALPRNFGKMTLCKELQKMCYPLDPNAAGSMWCSGFKHSFFFGGGGVAKGSMVWPVFFNVFVCIRKASAYNFADYSILSSFAKSVKMLLEIPITESKNAIKLVFW